MSLPLAACGTTLLLGLVWPLGVSGAQPTVFSHESSAPRPDEPAKLHAIRTGMPVTLDGRLDELFWNVADSISEFRQREPDHGALSTERMAVKFARDQDALYVGIRAYERCGRSVSPRSSTYDHPDRLRGVEPLPGRPRRDCARIRGRAGRRSCTRSLAHAGCRNRSGWDVADDRMVTEQFRRFIPEDVALRKLLREAPGQ